jgi:hypothetical protein
MANKYTGEVPIEIDGRDYTLVFTNRAVADLETELGQAWAQEVRDGMGTEVLVRIVAIGLRHRHPEMTADAVMASSMPRVPATLALFQALRYAAWGPNGPPAEDPGNPPERKTPETDSPAPSAIIAAPGSPPPDSGT